MKNTLTIFLAITAAFHFSGCVKKLTHPAMAVNRKAYVFISSRNTKCL